MKTLWIALSFLMACTGIIIGTSMRARQDSGTSMFSTSELLALRSEAGATSEESPWFPATAYYDQVRRIVEAEYVDPVTDKTKMARTSLRYLLRSLGDPETRYYEPPQWKAYTDRLAGKYQGIGADVLAQERMTPSGLTLPVKIISVAPEGPAAKAGLASGDEIDSVNGRWVATRSLFEELQRASDAFTAGSINRQRYDEIWKEVRKRSERMMSVDEAMETLMTGEGKVALQVRRAGKLIKVDVTRAPVEVEPVTVEGDIVTIRGFSPGTSEVVEHAVRDRSYVVFDLRSNPGGSFDEMMKVLNIFVSHGAIAQIKTDPKAPLEKVALDSSQEATGPKAIRVVVGPGTAREAEVFAAALRDVAGAVIEGGPMAGLGRRVQRFSLPDGSGYAITAGHYFDVKGKSLVREDNAAKTARAKEARR